MENSIKEKKVIGSIIEVWILTLLVLILCTCNGPRLMLGNQSLEKQIDYSTYSGKLVKPTVEVMECAISKTGVRAFLSWHQVKPLTWRPYQAIHDLGYCPNLEPMQRKCSQIKWYPYQLTTRSFLNQCKTVWTGQKQSLHTEYLLLSLQEEDSIAIKHKKLYQVLTPLLTGKIQEITPTMGRNLNYSYMMKAVNGKGQTTSSTTGGLQKQR